MKTKTVTLSKDWERKYQTTHDKCLCPDYQHRSFNIPSYVCKHMKEKKNQIALLDVQMRAEENITLLFPQQAQNYHHIPTFDELRFENQELRGELLQLRKLNKLLTEQVKEAVDHNEAKEYPLLSLYN